MTIGNRMKEIRGKLGMTQAELAEELDLMKKDYLIMKTEILFHQA